MCTAYVEFNISTSPVTISLENVRPYGARILFHQNQDLIDGKLLCDREFFLEKKVDGQWVRMKEGFMPLDVEDDPYDIALLAYQDVRWDSAYEVLPVGAYRLGKVIPVTSGENPEHKTIYAEFSIDKVYTWFDRYSNVSDEHHPKDNMLDIGVEGTGILSYHASENTTEADRKRFFSSAGIDHAVIIENGWYQRLRGTTLHIYEFSTEDFVLLDPVAGYYVAKKTQYPKAKYVITDPLAELLNRNVEVRFVDNLWQLADAVKASSLNWSLCRMANALPRG